ncbi:MAG: DUF2177 family protein [Rhodospirillaceae bacterium]|nr:DUF2177 family protein [Rhodospirillaceae bacterium]
MTIVYSYAITLALFLAADMAWLSAMVGRFYRPVMGDLLLAKPHPAPALLFYLLFPAGLTLFVVLPAVRGGGIAHAAIWGALFGLCTYGTYDLTNQATLRNWSPMLTIVDMAWGTLLSAGAAAGASWIITRLAT